MISSSEVPSEIVSFSRQCSEGLSGLSDNPSRIAFVQSIFPHLLSRPLLEKLLKNLVEGAAYPDSRYGTMFDTELILYTDPARRFSLRMFLWGPGQYDPVHDHNSWGVIGPVSGKLEVVKYRRLDDGSREGFALLEECERGIIDPGQTYFALPLDECIHKTGNPTGETMVQLSLYGEKQTGRDYVNGFDPANNRVYRIVSPRVKKRTLAEQALLSLEKERSPG